MNYFANTAKVQKRIIINFKHVDKLVIFYEF